jgi:hypothetical protein
MIPRRTPLWLSLFGLTLLVGWMVPGCNGGGAVADATPITGDEAGSGGEGGPVSTEAGADGSVDTSCVDMHMLEARPVQPSAVGLFVSVDNCKGEPVTNLDPKRFVIEEDGQTKSIEASVTPIPIKGQEIFVDLLIDMSTSTAGYRAQLFDAATQFVDTVSTSGANVQIGIYAFAGDAAPQEWLAPSLDAVAVKSKIASLGSYTPTDANSTNLYGAIGQTVQKLESSAADFRARNFGGAFTADYLIVFTAGRDTAKRATLADTVTAIRKTPATILGIAVQGPDYDADAATAFTQLASGGVVATDESSLSTTFAQLATRMEGQFKRTYLIGYCSPARATKPKVTVRLTSPTMTRTVAEAEFNAAGFGPGCDATIFDSCGDKTCGGLGCGACDDRVSGCAEISGRCANFCQQQGSCDGESITNTRGYPQVCNSIPGNLKCQTVCVDSTSDPANCGSCGHICPGTDPTCGGAPSTCGCGGGPCPVTLATGVFYSGIAVDANSVYFYGGAGGLMKVPVGGGTAITLAATTGIIAIAVDATSVYWITSTKVMKVPLGGGGPVTLASGLGGPTGAGSPNSIALDGASVYWTTSGSAATGTVMTVPLGGGALVTLAAAENSPSSIAVGGNTAYWTTASDVRTEPVGGGAAFTFATQQGNPVAIAVDKANVYWTNTYGGPIKAPLGGGVPVALVSTGDQGATAIAVDASSVYWGSGDGKLKRVPLGGGAAITLASGQVQFTPGGIAVDGTSVYWRAATGGGTLMKRTPK